MPTQIRHARGVARLSEGDAPRPIARDPVGPDWVGAAIVTAETRGEGLPLPIWSYRDGARHHAPGRQRHALPQDPDSRRLRGHLRADLLRPRRGSPTGAPLASSLIRSDARSTITAGSSPGARSCPRWTRSANGIRSDLLSKAARSTPSRRAGRSKSRPSRPRATRGSPCMPTGMRRRAGAISGSPASRRSPMSSPSRRGRTSVAGSGTTTARRPPERPPPGRSWAPRSSAGSSRTRPSSRRLPTPRPASASRIPRPPRGASTRPSSAMRGRPASATSPTGETGPVRSRPIWRVGTRPPPRPVDAENAPAPGDRCAGARPFGLRRHRSDQCPASLIFWPASLTF